MHNRITGLSLVAGVFLACTTGMAQTVTNGVRIYTEPAGLYFSVDGETFLDQVNFLWPANSKHVVSSWDQNSSPRGARYAVWQITTNLDSSKSLPAGQAITADPALQWIKISFKISYLIIVDLVACPDPSQPCLSTGTVEVNGILFDRYTEMYEQAGKEINAKAFPKAGNVFVGWAPVYGMSRVPSEFDITFNLTGPTHLAPMFRSASAVIAKVNVTTDPPQLKVFLDRTPYTAPVALDWEWGTTHAVGCDPVQVISGVTHVFNAWSDGGAINHDFQVPSQPGAISLTATFVPAANVNFTTSPPGLALNIDGRQNWPAYSFSWLPGSTHKIAAPATQTDAQGHKYRFVSWSNGKPASFDYTAGQPLSSDNVAAVYQAQGEATLTSDPPGLTLQIDGTPCVTPCAVEKDSGTTVNVTAPSMQNATEQSRLVFRGWADAADATRAIALTPDLKKYVAEYAVQNRLTLSATPAGSASFLLNPVSADAFYDAGDLVTVAAKIALGFRIVRWSGDLTGSNASAVLAMDSPKNATLILDPVPAVAPFGIQNAAAGASLDSVAPGSLISIFGANLAPELVIGPANPLAQTLATVTVRVDDAFLPLIYVSPQQINAQLPAATASGTHNLIVRWEGKPEALASLLVARNAPGLFNTGPQSQPVGTFVRLDGSTVTPDAPAQPGETISILGTGLGPYVMLPPDGFLLDETAGYTLADSVIVVLGDETNLNPIYAGRCGLGVGVDCVRFKLPASFSGPGSLPVRVRINGNASNTVFLPIASPAIRP